MQQTLSGTFRGGWSKPANALSGRLVMETETLAFGTRHAIYVELMNEALQSIVLTSQPRCDAALLDSAGTPVPTAGLPSSGPTPVAHWATLPPEAYIGLRIDMRTVAVPTKERGQALVAVGGRTWVLGAGTYELSVALKFGDGSAGPAQQWRGTLDLPPVIFKVTV
jgi:hypothetical protein